MSTATPDPSTATGSRWSLALWGAAACLLLVPLVAMQFTDEVDWKLGDFIIMSVMLALVCGCIELAIRTTRNLAYRAGVAVAVGAAFLLTWINLAVGIIGDEGNAANLMFAGVLAVGVAGVLVARFRPTGMAVAMIAAAVAQALVAAIALTLGLEEPRIIGSLSAFFMMAWTLAAGLFRTAAGSATADR